MLIDHERLQRLLGAGNYDQQRRSHKGWVEENLGDGAKGRQDGWTGSVAVGSKSFIESVKASLGFRARGRDILADNSWSGFLWMFIGNWPYNPLNLV